MMAFMSQRRASSVLPALAALAASVIMAAVACSDAAAKSRRGHRAKPAKVVQVTIKPERPARLLTRAEILAAEPGRLARIGRHVVIGFYNYSDVKELVAHRAIAGVFLTDHNVRGRSAEATSLAIAELQAMRSAQGMPPLIVAADQEGGLVSRLSPPLRRQPSLGRALLGLKSDAEIEPAVRAYAETQAKELKRIGVTLNFSPVVDLGFNPDYRGDGETRLARRTIARDPYRVAKVAGWYCDALAEARLMCTLKHFPGLGRVKRDTHVAPATIDASEGELELNDWVPFRRVMGKPNVATMLGHARLGAIDAATPASYSPAVISSLIRDKWKYKGLLITDDLSMGAVTRSPDGVGGAAVKALKAGADIVLVSFSEKYLDTILSALLEADERGELDRGQSAASFARLTRIVSSSALAGNSH